MAIILTAYPSSLELTQGEHVVEGSVQANDVEFRLPKGDDSWVDMALVACFETVLGARSQVLDNTYSCKIPWEVVDWGSAGSYLKIGLYGAKADDTNIIARDTTWVTMPFRILPGADTTPPSGSDTEDVPTASQEPTPSQYQQMLSMTSQVVQRMTTIQTVEQTVSAIHNQIADQQQAVEGNAKVARAAAGSAQLSADNSATSAAKAEEYARRAEQAQAMQIKTDDTLKMEDGVLKVNTATEVGDQTLPITAAAVNTTVGNIELLLATI